MDISSNLKKISSQIPDHVQLVAVSKTKPLHLLEEAYRSGQRIFGENKVQELVEKNDKLPKDIKWHMIGHLQRNKVKYIAPFVSLIHAVDTEKLLKEIQKEGKKNDRTISCLLQVHIAEEESKFGFNVEEINSLFNSGIIQELSNICVSGLMGMATNTSNSKQVKKEFGGLKKLFDQLQGQHNDSPNVDLQVLSMGMSGDYEIAIEEGSNMIRVGSSIFGKRP